MLIIGVNTIGINTICPLQPRLTRLKQPKYVILVHALTWPKPARNNFHLYKNHMNPCCFLDETPLTPSRHAADILDPVSFL